MTNQAPQAPENQAAAQNQGVDVSYHEPNGTAQEVNNPRLKRRGLESL